MRIATVVAAVLALTGASSCARPPRLLMIPTPWRDHPIDPALATAIQPGMSADDVIRLAGRAYALGGVTPLPPEAGPDTYSVHFDIFANREWSNATWIYVIRPHTPATSPPGDWCLFVEVKESAVVRTYQGRWVGWVM